MELIDIDKISPNPSQPRQYFDRESIEELANSIKQFGLINPIRVRPIGNGNYQIITGERRWRALKLLKWKKIPAIVEEVDEKTQSAKSLIENIHREDLEAFEKGKHIHDLFKLYGIEMSAKELAGILNSIRHYYQEHRTRPLNRTEKEIERICKEVIGKPLRTIITWLEAYSASPEIKREEIKKPKEERLPDDIIARLSTIDDEELQKRVYEKLVELKLPSEEASKFITKIKKAPEEVREEMLTPGLKIIIEEEEVKPVKVELTPEEAEELRKKIEEIEEEAKEILSKPEVKERGKWLRNWENHVRIGNYLENIFCPICGAGWENFGWICHNINIKEAVELSKKKLEELKGGENEGR